MRDVDVGGVKTLTQSGNGERKFTMQIIHWWSPSVDDFPSDDFPSTP